MKRFTWIILVLFVVALLFLSIAFNSNYRPFYANFYQANQTAQQLNLSEADLLEATDVLLDYIFFMRSDINVWVTTNQQVVQMFNQREMDHMVDVKVLFGMMLTSMSLIFILVGFWIVKLAKQSKSTIFSDLITHAKLAAIAISVFFGSILFVAIIDFQTFWTNFHLVLFRNDLWLLNPNTDRLIVMVPESFFIALITRIVLTWVGLILLFVMTLFVLSKKGHTHD